MKTENQIRERIAIYESKIEVVEKEIDKSKDLNDKLVLYDELENLLHYTNALKWVLIELNY